MACALTEAGERARTVRALFRRSGVRERGSVLADGDGRLPLFEDGGVPTTGARMRVYEAEALGLASEAASRALDDARADAASVTHLITVSCTGFASPGVDIGLIDSLGLSATVRRTHIGFMGCHGAINALAAARAFAASEPGARVLVVCVELCTLHFRASVEDGAMVANALFADGAAAGVVGGERAEGARELVSCSSVVVPDSRGEMGWTIGDAGFEMTLASGVPAALAARVPGWVDGWLGAHDLARTDVAAWAVHPGGPRVLDEVSSALGLAADAVDVSRSVLRCHGNMSSGTVLFILERLRDAAGPGCVLAFGPGLAGEGALLI